MLKYEVPTTWYDNCYLDKAPVIPAARSFSIIDGNKKAVLLIHGYAGYPGELVRPATDLAKVGFDCYIPRLPGMGTSGEDFQASSCKDYFTLLDNALTDLKARYESVSLVGHSMGTLLAVIFAKKYQINDVVLASPAFKFKGVTLFELKALAKVSPVIKKSWKSDPRFVMYYENAPQDDEALGKEYWSYLYVNKLIETLELAEKAKKVAKELTSNLLILTAQKDDLVDTKVGKFFTCQYKAVMLTNATHFMFYDIDKQSEEKAVSETVSFLE